MAGRSKRLVEKGCHPFSHMSACKPLLGYCCTFATYTRQTWNVKCLTFLNLCLPVRRGKDLSSRTSKNVIYSVFLELRKAIRRGLGIPALYLTEVSFDDQFRVQKSHDFSVCRSSFLPKQTPTMPRFLGFSLDASLFPTSISSGADRFRVEYL